MRSIFKPPLYLTKLLLIAGYFLFTSSVSANDRSTLPIPTSVSGSLERNQIPLDTFSAAVLEIEPGQAGKHAAKKVLDWRGKEPMNPASTMKPLTTLSSLDILGPQYRWRTNVYTDGVIRQGTLSKGICIYKAPEIPN
ncbi:D-alanyl-D-alanine carboxypeptidase [Polynucleobacter necessarius]|uniref:D-alanyl-D-alanine carboxypeptidase n=1 Tax=Polynucleobacter necessarius TaxID=576610 RepID=UPI0018D52412|nr:D-alanyl-D-alanine carboxypeptidase [Polynucleobacter necessarius]